MFSSSIYISPLKENHDEKSLNNVGFFSRDVKTKRERRW